MARISPAAQFALDQEDANDNGIIFPQITEVWIELQKSDNATRKWSGRLAPSSVHGYKMCMEEYFAKVDEPLVFDDKFLCQHINPGTLMHKAFEEVLTSKDEKQRTIYTHDWPISRLTQSSKDQYVTGQVYPEVYVHDTKTGVSFKMDRLFAIDSEREDAIDGKEPLAWDWKCTLKPEKTFQYFCEHKYPLGKNKLQVNICVNRANALGLTEIPILKCGLGYYNMQSEKPMFDRSRWFEAVWDYSEYRQVTNSFVRHWALCRWQKINGKTVKCTYPLCKQGHGK